MRTCVKCGAQLKQNESMLCIDCDPSICEGCTVMEEFGNNQGKAFIKNTRGQWLVFWNNGRVDIVHHSNLKKVSA